MKSISLQAGQTSVTLAQFGHYDMAGEVEFAYGGPAMDRHGAFEAEEKG